MKGKDLDPIFVIILNKSLLFNDHLNEIIKFEIKRIKNYYNTCYLLDTNKISIKSKLNYKKTFFSFSEFKKYCTSIKRDSPVIIIDSRNPLLDIDLIKEILENFQFSNNIKISGAIPGTAPEVISYTSFLKKCKKISDLESNSKLFYHDSQQKHNNIFDLYRPIRTKIFLRLLKKIPDIDKISIEKFMQKLKNKDIFNFVLNYGEENIIVKKIKQCPNCKSKKIKPIYYNTSQPLIGFLSNKVSSYYECEKCKLVFLRNQCNIKDLKKFYDDYERNKPLEKNYLENYLKNKGNSHFIEKKKVLEIIESLSSKNISLLDLGGGLGEFAYMAKIKNSKWDVHCIDFDLKDIQKKLNKNSIQNRSIDFINNSFGQNFDVITIMHVLEHIPFQYLDKFIEKIHSSLKKGGFFIITTPDYHSPLSKIFDYHLLYPPHHQTIFSNEWLKQYITKKFEFKKIRQESACIILEKYEQWFSFYNKTAPNDEFKSVIEIFEMMRKDKQKFSSFYKSIIHSNKGSETILVFQKK